MDYDQKIMLIALVAHRRIEGGTTTKVSEFAQDLFERFDEPIRDAAAKIDLDVDDAMVRSVIAALARLEPGTTADECAVSAVAIYKRLFAN